MTLRASIWGIELYNDSALEPNKYSINLDPYVDVWAESNVRIESFGGRLANNNNKNKI